MLEFFFDLAWMETGALAARGRTKGIAFPGIPHIRPDGRDNRREEQQALRPNGFTETDGGVGLSGAWPQKDSGHGIAGRPRRS